MNLFATSGEELLLSELIQKCIGKRVLLFSQFIESDGGSPVLSFLGTTTL